MKLTEKPDFIIWDPTEYTFIESAGPFVETAPACWRELHAKKGAGARRFFAQYRPGAKPVYRAGYEGPAAPQLAHERFAGGRYARFVLTGSYAQLPAACGRVFEIVAELALPVRDGWYLEHYVNDPATTAPDQLVTEILIPVA